MPVSGRGPGARARDRAGLHLGEAEVLENKVGRDRRQRRRAGDGRRQGRRGPRLLDPPGRRGRLRLRLRRPRRRTGLKGIDGEWRLYEVTAARRGRAARCRSRAEEVADPAASSRRAVPVRRRRDRVALAAAGRRRSFVALVAARDRSPTPSAPTTHRARRVGVWTERCAPVAPYGRSGGLPVDLYAVLLAGPERYRVDGLRPERDLLGDVRKLRIRGRPPHGVRAVRVACRPRTSTALGIHRRGTSTP